MQCVQAFITVKNTDAAVLLDGIPAGDAPQLLTLPASGTHYITAAPLKDAAGHYAVTRRLCFDGGMLTDAGESVSVYDWGGGLFEAELWCGTFARPRDPAFPYTLMQLPYEGMTAVLYYENGLWLALENNRRLLTGASMGEAREGELLTMGRLLICIAHGEKDFARVLAPDRTEIAMLSADRIAVEDGMLVTIEGLRTQRGHERRTAYRADGIRLIAEQPRIGFFTHEANSPVSIALACCEAVQLGLCDEALSMMHEDLRTTLDSAAIRAFFGDFTAVRPYLSDSRVVGLVQPSTGKICPVRKIRFSIENMHIIDITEAD